MLVSVDVYRPAAREQLKVVAKAVSALIYEGAVAEPNTASVERLAKESAPRSHSTAAATCSSSTPPDVCT